MNATYLPIRDPETGAIRSTKKGNVRWTLAPDEAREIADFIERVTADEDSARKDASALRFAAWAIDGQELPK